MPARARRTSTQVSFSRLPLRTFPPSLVRTLSRCVRGLFFSVFFFFFCVLLRVMFAAVKRCGVLRPVSIDLPDSEFGACAPSREAQFFAELHTAYEDADSSYTLYVQQKNTIPLAVPCWLISSNVRPCVVGLCGFVSLGLLGCGSLLLKTELLPHPLGTIALRPHVAQRPVLTGPLSLLLLDAFYCIMPSL